MNRHKFWAAIIITSQILLVGTFAFGQSQVQWQAVNNLITAIQTQLNSINTSINNALPAGTATNGQVIVGQTSTRPVWATCSGNIGCSSVTPGLLSITSLATLSVPVSITNTTTDGSGQLSRTSVNQAQNVQAYGATCSNTTISCTLSGTTTLSCASIGDFVAGQHISIQHAGVANTLSTPTISSVANLTYGVSTRPEPPFHDASDDASGCNTDSVTASLYHNPTCTTNHSYEIVNVADNGSNSAPSAKVSASNGPAVLSTDNWVRPTWTTDPNAEGTILCGCSGSSCTPTIMATFANIPVGQTVGGTFYYDDMGVDFGQDIDLGTACPTVARPANYQGQIVSISGAGPYTVTLNSAVTQSGTFTVHHDSAPAWQSALSAVCPTSNQNNCGTVQVPRCNGYYEFGSAVSFYGMLGPKVVGANGAGQGAYGSAIQWDGPTGGIVFNLNGSGQGSIEGLGVIGTRGNSPGLVYSADNNSAAAGPGGNPDGRTRTTLTHWKFKDTESNGMGIGVTLNTNQSIGNVEDFTFDNFSCSGAAPHFACYYASMDQSDAENIKGGVIAGGLFGFYLNNFGSVSIDGPSNSDLIGIWTGSNPPFGTVLTEKNGFFGGSMLFDHLHGGGITTFENVQVEEQPGPSGYIGEGAFAANSGATLYLKDNTLSSLNGISSNIGLNSGGTNLPGVVSTGNQYAALSNNNVGGSYPATPGGIPFTDNNGGGAAPLIDSFFDTANTFGVGDAYAAALVLTGSGYIQGNTSASNSNSLYNFAQVGNGNDTMNFYRATDSASSGNIIRLLNHAANAQLFAVNSAGSMTAAGTLTAGSGPTTVTNSSGTLIASAIDNTAIASLNSTNGAVNASLGQATPHAASVTNLAATAGGPISVTGGSVPTITCSGGSTGTSVAAGSTNNRGQVVTSSSASTNCTITWNSGVPFPQAPFCMFVDGSASITPTTFSTGACGTTTCVFDFASATSKTVNYLCL